MNEGALMLTREGVILFCNRRFAQQLALPIDGLVGRDINSIADPAVRGCLTTLVAQQETECQAKELTFKGPQGGRILSFASNRLTQDGTLAILVTDVTDARQRTAALASRIEELRDARLAALNVMDDAVGTARDLERANRDLESQITETRKSDDANRRLATVVKQATESIVITDLEGTITYVNPAFERITGFTAEEAVGLDCRIIATGKHNRAFYRELWKTIHSGRVWSGHFINRRKDGSEFEEEATISPVRDSDGTIVSFVAVKRDVTEEVAMAAQLRHAQKMEAVGTLAGGVAHDFNNLLQAMLSMVQLLQRTGTSHVEHLSQLEKAIRRGASLTRQLLLFARRETARQETVDLNQILRDLVAFLSRVVRENVHLNIRPPDVPCWIAADRGQIEQVIMNLAVNAVDAMPEGGLLSISATSNTLMASLEVTDTGVGIPEAIRERIFEPFFTTKESGKGTGLGLSVVHGIVDSHGGKIEVDYPPEGGTTFRIELPIQKVIDTIVPAGQEEEVPHGHGELVLLVEDEDGAREGLCEILEMLGYSVRGVGTAEEALAVNQQTPISIAVTDFMLPGMNGVDLVRSLHKVRPEMKAIVMSGYAPPGAIDTAVSSRELQFLQKPFDMATLAQTIHSALLPSHASAG
jgi:PAS domain S-box-containing protein